MRFLLKNPHASILLEDIVYKKSNHSNNKILLDRLKAEQKNFCAYTEKYFLDTESCEVEHFNSQIKYKDNYYNYYAVIRTANLYKKDEKYKVQALEKSSFFNSSFHQTKEIFERIRYVEGEYVFEEIDENDTEAKELIDFLGFNDERLVKDRKRHIERLKYTFVGNYSKEQIIDYLQRNPDQLSFITALQIELDLDLYHLIG